MINFPSSHWLYWKKNNKYFLRFGFWTLLVSWTLLVLFNFDFFPYKLVYKFILVVFFSYEIIVFNIILEIWELNSNL